MKMLHPDFKSLEEVLTPIVEKILDIGELCGFAMRFVDDKVEEYINIFLTVANVGSNSYQKSLIVQAGTEQNQVSIPFKTFVWYLSSFRNTSSYLFFL